MAFEAALKNLCVASLAAALLACTKEGSGGVESAALVEYGAASYAFYENVSITPVGPSRVSSKGSFSISPELPPGLSLNTKTGGISGRATTTSAPRDYTISLTKDGQTDSFVVEFSVKKPQLRYNIPHLIWLKDYPLNTSLSPSLTGFTAQDYSVSGSLPTGLSLNSATGVISGTPTATFSEQTLTLTACSPSCASPTVSASFNVTFWIIPTGYVVDSSGDSGGLTCATPLDDSDGDCDLRSALTASNADSNTQNIIVFKSSITTITRTLASPLPATTKDLVIFGNGTGATVIDGWDGSTNRRIFETVTANISLFLVQMGFSRAGDASDAAVIEHQGGASAWLVLEDCFVEGSVLISPISTTNTPLDVHRCRFENNSGVIIASGDLVVRDSSFINNTETPLYQFGQTLDLQNSLFMNNSSSTEGGAVLATFATPILISNNTFIQNSGLRGGALAIYQTATISNNTFRGNQCTGLPPCGASIFINDFITDLTANLSNNIFTEGSADHCALHTWGGAPPDYVSLGSNLSDSGASDCDLSHPTDLVNQSLTDIGLEDLADNGGYTQTAALSKNSLAIDAGQAAQCTSSTDQRGLEAFSRIVDGDHDSSPTCDIGAYEFQ